MHHFQSSPGVFGKRLRDVSFDLLNLAHPSHRFSQLSPDLGVDGIWRFVQAFAHAFDCLPNDLADDGDEWEHLSDGLSDGGDDFERHFGDLCPGGLDKVANSLGGYYGRVNISSSAADRFWEELPILIPCPIFWATIAIDSVLDSWYAWYSTYYVPFLIPWPIFWATIS